MSDDYSARNASWALHTPVSAGYDEEFVEFWGDEQTWSGLLAQAWLTVDQSNLTVAPIHDSRPENRFYCAAQAWTTLTHLLMLGLGWNDPCKGLSRWRENGYPTGVDPILDFTWRTVGEEIEALEVYFGLQPRYEIQAGLPGLRHDIEHYADQPLNDTHRDYYAERLERWHRADDSRWLGRALLVGGSDPLHLSAHVGSSFRQRSEDSPVSGERTKHPEANLVCLRVARYAGWAHALPAAPDDEYGDSDERNLYVLIDGLGSLGRFDHDERTGRWYRVGARDGEGPSRRAAAHRWGFTPGCA